MFDIIGVISLLFALVILIWDLTIVIKVNKKLKKFNKWYEENKENLN